LTFEQRKGSQYYDQTIGRPYEHTSLNHHEDLEYYHYPLARMQHAHLHGVGIACGRLSARNGVVRAEQGSAHISLTSAPETVPPFEVMAEASNCRSGSLLIEFY
jgi:hypothetical protein